MRNLTRIVTMSATSLVLLIGAACGQTQEEAEGEAAPAAEDVSDEGQSQDADDEGAGDEGDDDEGADDEGDDDEGDDDEGN